MCGIVGEWRLDGRAVIADRLIAARDTLIARGPDDAGVYVDGAIGLAHRRLSIIDLSPAGRMPMSNADGSVWGVFNGELYNFRALRAELEAHGHTFRSRSDSEVVIHAYEQWGTECFRRFDAMFAVAIWDRSTRRLVLARDLAGEKPLYYAFAPGRHLLFGSTLTALLAYHEVAATVDPESLRDYAEFGYVPAPRSILRDVHKLEPGTSLVFQPDAPPRAHRYWSLEHVATEPRTGPAPTLECATDELHDRLRRAVRARMESDVPLGAFLSGGIDSSLVVALMAERQSKGVQTFTIGYSDPRFDESGHAARIAQHLGVTNTIMMLTPADVLRELAEVTRAFDEPMADYSVLPSLAVARLARQHVTVALTGDGADEAFGGYRYYNGTRIFERVAGIVPRWLRARLARRAALVPAPRLERAIRRSVSEDAGVFFGRSGFYRGATSGPRLKEVLPRSSGRLAPEERVAEYVRAHATLSATEAGMLWDATHTLPDAWLTKVDRTTMAVGLEARAPFLDRSVLEYAFRLPLPFRVRGLQRKVILRRVLARHVPRALFERPKQGFTAPLKTWFAKELRDELHARLAPARIARFEVFDPRAVQAVLADHEAGRVDHTQLLWALFHLDRWREAYVDVPRPRVESVA
jgi:asparagine synthase (glutamine-hydrolysing)